MKSAADMFSPVSVTSASNVSNRRDFNEADTANLLSSQTVPPTTPLRGDVQLSEDILSGMRIA
jgi:hypothetical protein